MYRKVHIVDMQGAVFRRMQLGATCRTAPYFASQLVRRFLPKVRVLDTIRDETGIEERWMYEGAGAVCAGITALIIFVGSWLYCIAEYGFLLGVGLGWLPSAIVAGIGALLWPLLFVAVVLLVIFVAGSLG